ncbi:TonB-dependent receptor [Phenylobacterium sp. LjRoot225]|uniref:TonB-dependent receptor plug domain-containing protein n=1 Tax=Phenylobacterium sp. LjRoot225 TaxID=3342285 RepID=UPI003ECD0A6E
MKTRAGWLAAGITALAPPAWAQADVAGSVSELVVVGSRGTPRLITETASPVDVLSGQAIAARGYNDLTKALEFLAPSFNYPRSSSGPSVAGARPATLRGLSPDQTLVLVNGRRRHASALITFNAGAFRGSVPVDFNTLPVTAVSRVEVLRDGAAAQYGSDAIAGVINIRLHDEAEGGEAFVQYGETERGEGQTTLAGVRQGFRLGRDGFLNLTAEARDRQPTNAAEIDPRFGRVTSTFGDPETTDVNLVANARKPLTERVAAYGFLTYAHRDSEMSPLFRAPSVFPALYPNGFLPKVGLELEDLGADVGLTGELAGWTWDLSDTYGYSRGDYRVSNTVNTSLGLASPTSFYGGAARYSQNLVNLTLDRGFKLLAGAHLAVGLEHRREDYRLVSGAPASYTLAGAQGFPGFNPPTPVDVDRHAVSAFVDGEITPVDGFKLAGAARYEDYSDFGDRTTWKASAFWRPAPLVALRATASTGLRAPSLQQQFFSTVTSQVSAGQLQNVGTFAVNDPISIALGASPLKPEKSKNYSAGVVLTPGYGLTASFDLFRIDIDDRIALSENLQGAQVAAILRAHGVTNAAVARFFTNAADTRTEGFEATLRWDRRLSPDARLGLTLGYGAFDTDVRAQRTNPVLPSSPLLGVSSIDLMTDGQPRNKLVVGGELNWRAWRVSADVTRFGAYRSTAATGSANQVFNGPTSLDLAAAYRWRRQLTLAAGVLNATNELPDRLIGESTGRPYSEFDPLGVNGREYYLRLTAEF